MIIVSACLLGENCKYNGENNSTEWVRELMDDHMLCMVCPEILGKLLIPRAKSEIQPDGRVVNEVGEDVTQAFELGAKIAYQRAVVAAKKIGEDIEYAILKSNSPSCGRDQVYDGSFTGKLVDGEGYFAKLLREKGIKVYTEKENPNERL